MQVYAKLECEGGKNPKFPAFIDMRNTGYEITVCVFSSAPSLFICLHFYFYIANFIAFIS